MPNPGKKPPVNEKDRFEITPSGRAALREMDSAKTEDLKVLDEAERILEKRAFHATAKHISAIRNLIATSL